MVPEDQELDRQDHSSSMGSSRGGLLGISGSPARSSPRHTGNGSHAVHRCVQLGLGSLTRLTLDSGSAFLRSPHINILEMQAVISAVREFLLHLRSIVVRLMCDNAVTGCLHQEWRGHAILHSHAGDDTPAEVVQSQGNQAGASPSGWCSVQDRSDSQHWVDVGYGTSMTSVLQVGRTTDRHVCYILQQTTDQVCIAISASQGRVDGRDVHFLGQREGPLVRIPVTEAGPSGATEDLTVSWSANDSCGSIARNSSLVSGASGTIARRSDPTVHRRSTTANPRRHSARLRDGNPSLPAVKSTPMETLQPS